ncbi:phosphoenolpyruvate carboxykinase (ATP) [Alkalilimnicola sp. S0819]|uniref:phosphoenolpyruvate carboxykinase (ATP) n=1 Tax=Alkalilimnicola sp. S0819 TaxID=2613922 RepID=UPI001262492C|nr:phosphoenolpyruvate carboxykinase (ATP) [Alkalilimnicola sp. S0819]KAB7627661.1 phosphoenolpyruvate carboxykinase (ATP) [Alkalilimnicola sp. S0819]MPQ15828.1 phosphoenolpyruvate carboxykinase (ATP) [Alkalilimnicola sp. S0819]
MSSFDLQQHGIVKPRVLRNAAPAELYEQALRNEPGSAISSSGALIALSGEKTGRSPKDKRVVEHQELKDDVWWGDVNISLEESTFRMTRQLAVDYLNTREQLYVVDGYAGWDSRYRVKIRVICERAYHALFMRNMLIRPSAAELAEFGEPDYVIYNAGRFPANDQLPGISSKTSVSLCLKQGEFVILGTEYAGEMKKGVFTIMNYIMPKQDVLSMHGSANEGPHGDVSIFFGLSGTGKTTLSADPARRLIGDDEHCWTDDGVFNIEGGCYAKVIDLSAEAEPDIYNAIRFGAVLENVVYDPTTREVDYTDKSITENTRCSYPVEFIPNCKIPGTGAIPKNVIFLTCDAFSVLPPVSKLNPAQAMYHFISGYTAKVAGTEMGVTEPQATFSACFGAPFLVWHPTRYAELLADKIRKHDVKVWMVNTGWSGGPYGVGKRMSIAHTRAIIDAIHDGSLDQAETVTDPIFGLEVPTQCPNVPDEVLIPVNSWADKDAYRETAIKLAKLYQENFAAYADQASEEILAAAPRVPGAGEAIDLQARRKARG